MDESEIKTPQFGRVSNPEFEVGTLNMKTDDVNDCLSNPDIFSLHVAVPTPPTRRLHDSSLGRHVNAASRESLEIQAYSITKPRAHLE